MVRIALGKKKAAKASRELPPGWTTGVSRQGRTVYINHETKSTSWDPPGEDTTSGSNTIHVASFGAVAANKPDDRAEPPLAEGRSKEVTVDGEVYYKNHQTKTTTWDRPTTQVETASQPAPTPGSGTMPVAYSEGVAANKPGDKKEPPLPAGWSKEVTQDGEVYYKNHQTKTTTWDRPTIQEPTASQATPPQGSGTMPVAYSEAVAANEPDHTEEPPLPAGWSKKFTPDGEVYYQNHETKATSWDRPTTQEQTVSQAATLQGSGTMPVAYSEAVATDEPDHTEEPPLPAGWSKKFTPDGEVYYQNHETKATSWDRPTTQEQTVSQAATLQGSKIITPVASSGSVVVNEPDNNGEPTLPEGWIKEVTKD